MIDPELDRLAAGGHVAVVKINVDENRDLARHYRVTSIPDVYLFNQGKAITHRVGGVDYDHLRSWIKQNLSH